MKKVTMGDIAQKLGVSRALVSYALTDKYGVSEEMRRAIITQAVEMGYFEKKLPSIRYKKNIAVLIGHQYISENSFFTRIVAGIESGIRNKKYNMHLLTVGDYEDSDDIITRLVQTNAHGLIVIRQFTNKLAEQFEKVNIPKVYIDLVNVHSSFNETRINNLGNMGFITKYVLEKGHKNLLFVGDIEWALSFQERYYGFLYAVKNKNIRCNSIIGRCNTGDLPYDRESVIKFLKEDNCTAIICANDSVADYVYKDIKKIGLKIPDDISVVGFDDVMLAKKFEPSLTTMHVPKFELGKVAFEMLDEQFNEQKTSRIICLNCKLVERESVKDVN